MTILNKSKFTGRWSTIIHTSLHKSDWPRSREMSARPDLIFWALSSLLGVKMFLCVFCSSFRLKGTEKKAETLCLKKGLYIYITLGMIWFNKHFVSQTGGTFSVTKWVYRITRYFPKQSHGIRSDRRASSRSRTPDLQVPIGTGSHQWSPRPAAILRYWENSKKNTPPTCLVKWYQIILYIYHKNLPRVDKIYHTSGQRLSYNSYIWIN